jgi:hypothetical protein
MRRWWKSLGLVASGLLSLGGIVSSANAQFPPSGGGGFGMPPGVGMMGPPPGMAPGMMTGMGMPPGGGMMGQPPGAFGGNPKLGGMPAEFPNAAQPSKEPVSPFSIKEDGRPNAFNDCEDPRLISPTRFTISAGYTVMWLRAAGFPALLTTGDINDTVPGGLGQPGTAILSNGLGSPGAAAAFRMTATYWLADPETLGLEANFFIMEQRTRVSSFASDANGSPVLTRPFFNAVAFQEDADPRALPGFPGSTSDALTTRLMGGELNLRWFSPQQFEGAGLNFLAGVRWLRLDERYVSFDATTVSAVSTTLSDRFTTYNQFFGGQLGAEWQYRMQRFTFGMMSKLAIGPNYQTIKINGETVQVDPVAQTTITANQGLFAMPSNIGVYRAPKIAILPELGFKFRFDLTESIRFNLGYTFFLLNNTVRPGDQIDRSVNIQALNAPQSLPALPAPPTFHQNTFNAQMLNFGLEFRF